MYRNLSKEKKWRRTRIARLKEFKQEYLEEHPCVDCGESDPVVLDFDHVDPADKFDGISHMIRAAYSLARLQAEIAKCQIRCANCHRRRTYEQAKTH